MALDLNKFYNIGTLTKAQVDANWDAIIGAFGDAEGLNQATPSQIIAMTVAAIVTPHGIGQALDWVPISYAASLSLNGDDFVQGELTLTGNSELIQPTNFLKGTKYLLVKGSSATPRTLSFDEAYFKGEIPTLVDITNSRWYLLCLVALASDHIVVMSHRALG